MLERLEIYLRELKNRKDIYGFSEADTKQSIILYILSLLGWNPFDAEEVKPEYGVGGSWVDYALRIYSTPKVFIEVKKVQEKLDSHEEQLVTYATKESVKLAVLTNGLTWWLYLPLVEGRWDQKKFYTIDVSEQEPDQAAEKFFRFLSKETTSSGEAITQAEAVINDRRKDSVISNTLPKAWNRLIDSTDDVLVQLLKENTEKLCGYEIEVKTVTRFFEQNKDTLLIQNSNNTPLKPSIRSVHKPDAPIDDVRRGKETTLRAIIDWQSIGKSLPQEVFENDRGVRIFLQVLECIAKHVGMAKFRELLSFQVRRGMLLSKVRTKYHRKELLDFYVLTYNATDEKAQIILDVVAKFNLPPDFIRVEVVD